MVQQAASAMGGGGGGGANLELGGNISVRVENGRVVAEAASTTSSSAGEGINGTNVATGANGANGSIGATGTNGANGARGGSATPGEGSSPGSPAGIRHPPPSLLAEVMEQYNTAQARLAGLSSRVSSLLREDPALEAGDVEQHQTD